MAQIYILLRIAVPVVTPPKELQLIQFAEFTALTLFMVIYIIILSVNRSFCRRFRLVGTVF